MRNKIFLISLLFLSQNVNAEEMKHGSDGPSIYHAFTAEGEIGEARDGRAKGFDLDGWMGGDDNRLWLKSEQKSFGQYDQKSEVQALYGRNISQFWDAQIGMRHDFSTDFTSNNVNYLTVALEGLAPYMFETNVQLFLSDQGNYSARFKQEVDILLTQRLIMQPYIEAEMFVQNVPKLQVKSGLAEIETGIVTRYEMSRKFAPYIAFRYHTKTGSTANLSQKLGDRVDNFIASVGLRVRF